MQLSKHYEWILNKVNIGVHVVDSQGVTTFYNQTMADIDGLVRETVLGKNIFQLYPSLTSETSTLNLALSKGCETVDVMQTYVNLQGKQITTINSTYPLYEGELIIGAVETAKEITQIVSMYDQTLELRKQLFQSKKLERISKGSAVYHFSDLIGKNPNFQQAVSISKRAARSLSPVMIYGATGTGKELVAQSIHNASARRQKPFIALNCAAVPKELLEGLLFGTSKGAFTGAIDRPGIFEQADGGTLFLDELNSLHLLLQAKLLRVIQDGRIRRLGGNEEKKVDVRIISAMNIKPKKALEKKILRSDLYYRLNVVHIELPLLKDRKGDIPILIDHFIKKCNDLFGLKVKEVSIEALQYLSQYDWPGNIRELDHAIESAFNIIDFGYEMIEKHHLPSHIFNTASQVIPETARFSPIKERIDLPNIIEEFERETIFRMFNDNDRNISKTAKALGIKRQALQYKLNKYGIEK
ncbi:Fis family transcriptional regulator [Anaerobacillus alkalidiazotrophicus]|uniref:Fis family transcriptional regulator n=1 Tax=Anaerobacillus alkalidiazotrophicus TaxID=472963 RepID=A0A1S2M5U8_9BACI|nr:sigma 54-interacting transcriptional regulator [Anaerobacillus alkalidiazotrophicus]OIJ19237.1 Fis family transcriptional regulator [Anaerobacillus alkalidiazotrophicus]